MPKLTILVTLLVVAGFIGYQSLDREHRGVAEDRGRLAPENLVATQDGLTHVQMAGPESGQTLVLLHGGTVPMGIWEAHAGPLADAGFRVLRFDAFGRGLSDRVAGPYDRDLHVRQLMDLLDALGWSQPVVLVGTSLGGATAATAAVEHPGRVAALVLVAPVVDYRDQVPGVLRWPGVGEVLMRLVGVPLAERRIADWAGTLPGGDRLLADFQRQIGTRGFEALLLSLARDGALGDYRPTYARLGELDLPVLLIWGRQDTEIPPAHMADLRDRIPQLAELSIDGAGHAVALSEHARVVLEIRDFVTRLP